MEQAHAQIQIPVQPGDQDAGAVHDDAKQQAQAQHLEGIALSAALLHVPEAAERRLLPKQAEEQDHDMDPDKAQIHQSKLDIAPVPCQPNQGQADHFAQDLAQQQHHKAEQQDPDDKMPFQLLRFFRLFVGQSGVFIHKNISSRFFGSSYFRRPEKST